MSGAGSIEEGVPLPASPSKPSTPLDVWLPPLRLGDVPILPSPFSKRVDGQSDRQSSTRSSALQPKSDSSLSFHQKIAKMRVGIGAAGNTQTQRGLGRVGDLSARKDRLKNPQSPRRPLTSRSNEGALGWLYREPARDDLRMQTWILNNPAPECMLRQALRTPLIASSPRNGPGESILSTSLSSFGLQHSPDQIDDICEKQTEQIGALVREVGRYRPPETPVLTAGFKRVDRIKQFVADELKLMEEERAAEAAMLAERELMLRTPPEVIKEISKDLLLDACMCSRSLGTLGLATSESGLQKILQRCQALRIKSANVSDAVSRLVQETETDEHRAWSMFCWLCHNIKYDVAGATTAEAALTSRIASSLGFAHLFAALCTEGGLSAQVVTGHARSYAGHPMEDVCCNDDNCHAWNFVELNGRRTVVDCARGAGFCGRGVEFVKSFRPYFFGPDPDDLFYTHFPSDPQHQLLASALDYSSFLAQPQVNPDVFFGFGLGFYPEQRSVEATPKFIGDTNTGRVTLKVPRNVRVKASLDGDESLCMVAPAPAKTRLKITVISASQLRNADGGTSYYDKSDPYCKVQIQGKPGMVWKTKVIKDSLDPVWNQSFEISDCDPGDKLKFEVFDHDLVSAEDLLGSCLLTTDGFHSGQGFEGEVELSEDGAFQSKLQLRVEVLPSGVSSLGSSRKINSPPELVTILFRTKRGSGQQRLEVYARRASAKVDLFRRACTWMIQAPDQPQDFFEPVFPLIQDAFKNNGLEFVEVWPVGRIFLEDQSEVNLRFIAPIGVQVLADVDGNRTQALVQPSPALDTLMEVRAQIGSGEHDVNICVRPSRTDVDYERAITYRIARQPQAPSFGSSRPPVTPAFPQGTDTFRELRARLEEPLAGELVPGRVRFRLFLGAEYAPVVLVTGDRREHLSRRHDGRRGSNRRSTVGNAAAFPTTPLWDALLTVMEPEATLLCSLNGEMVPLLRWTVVKAPSPVRGSSRPASRPVSRQPPP